MAITREEVLKRMIKVTSEVLDMDPARIKETSRFVGDLGAESVQSIDLVASFEEEFGIEMDEEGALGCKDIKSGTDFIFNLLKKKGK